MFAMCSATDSYDIALAAEGLIFVLKCLMAIPRILMRNRSWITPSVLLLKISSWLPTRWSMNFQTSITVIAM